MDGKGTGKTSFVLAGGEKVLISWWH